MPRTDFYLLAETQFNACLNIACRIIEKAYQAQQSVYVYTCSDADAVKLAELLWTYKDIGFIPHHIVGDTTIKNSIVEIGYGNKYAVKEILINLTQELPHFAKDFSRIIEVIPQETAWQTSAREHYQFYQKQQWPIQVHNLGKDPKLMIFN